MQQFESLNLITKSTTDLITQCDVCVCVCVHVCDRARVCHQSHVIPAHGPCCPGCGNREALPTVVRSTANCKTIKTASPSAQDHRTRIMSGIVPGTVPVRTKLRPTPKMVLCFGRVFDPGSNRESSRHKKKHSLNYFITAR